MVELFNKFNAPLTTKLDNFEKYVRWPVIARFLARYELFKMQLNTKGSIVECGVHNGGGLMAWAKFSAAFEPYAVHRRIFGFDTFEGFPSIDAKDSTTEANEQMKQGGLDTGYNVYDELLEAIDEFDKSRYYNKYKKVFLIKGDAVETIPQFVKDNPYLLVSLLFLDFDLYEPTKAALEYFLPRMSKGAILAFDEVNNAWWPGETAALLESLSIRNHQINRFSFDPNIAYIIL